MIRFVVGGQPRIHMHAKGMKCSSLRKSKCKAAGVGSPGSLGNSTQAQLGLESQWMRIVVLKNCCHGQHSFELWLLAHV